MPPPGRPRAAGAAVATTLAGFVTLAASSPSSWLTAALVPPLAVLGLRLVRRDGGPWVRTALLTGLVLGLAAVVAVHELAEIVVIANGVRAGRTKPLGGTIIETGTDSHRLAHTRNQKTTAAS